MVQRLPLEVIIRILSYVSISDCAQLTSSCRFWHEFIVNQPPAIWTHANISEVTGQYHALPKWFNSYLDSKGKQCIKSIKLDISTPDDRVARQVFNRIAQEKWNKVESLGKENAFSRRIVIAAVFMIPWLKKKKDFCFNNSYFFFYIEIVFRMKPTFVKKRRHFERLCNPKKNSIKSLTMHTAGNYINSLKNIF